MPSAWDFTIHYSFYVSIASCGVKNVELKGGTMADEAVDKDVNQAETDTAGVSSDTEQTTQETPSTSDQGSEQSTEEMKSVPYDRFKEVNEKAKQYEQEMQKLKEEFNQFKESQKPQEPADPQVDAVKQKLKELGFITKEEQEAELRRREEDARVQQELTRLEKQYDGKNGLPQI
jgi:hypothetical protein